MRAVTISAAFGGGGLVLSVLFAIPLALTVFLLAVQLRARWSRLLVLMFLIITYLLYASQLVYYKIFFQFYSATSMGNAGQVVQFLEGCPVCHWEKPVSPSAPGSAAGACGSVWQAHLELPRQGQLEGLCLPGGDWQCCSISL